MTEHDHLARLEWATAVSKASAVKSLRPTLAWAVKTIREKEARIAELEQADRDFAAEDLAIRQTCSEQAEEVKRLKLRISELEGENEQLASVPDAMDYLQRDIAEKNQEVKRLRGILGAIANGVISGGTAADCARAALAGKGDAK